MMIVRTLKSLLQSPCGRCLMYRNGLLTPQKQLSTFNKRQILSYSSTFIQDGVEINEIPIIVRHTDIYSLGSSRKPLGVAAESDSDIQFKQQLYNCKSVSEVLKLLNMPADRVTAHSSAYALQRLVQLQTTCQQQLSSFIQTAVLNELCDTATKSIEVLSNKTLLELMQCATANNFQSVYVDRVREEAEKRIGDSQFTVGEICRMIHLLGPEPSEGLDMLDSLWIHLGNRAQDIDETNVVEAYSTAKLMKSEQRYLLDILLKRLYTFWWKLSSREITTIASMSVRTSHKNAKVMNLLGKWSFMNIKEVNDLDLAQMIAAYSLAHHYDKNFINALERYITENVRTMNTDIIALAMEYLRQLRFISPRIFDIVSSHLARNSDTFTATQLLLLLRPYGQLNYEPLNVSKVFEKLEDVLLKKFDDFSPVSMVELLSSFVYLRRLPLNFINKVFNAHFLSQVNVVTEPALKARLSRQLKQIQCAVKLEMQYCHLPFLFMDSGDHYLWLDAKQYTVSQEVQHILDKLLGSDQFASMVTIPKTPYFVDFEITVDGKGNLAVDGSERVAVTILMPECFCSSHHHLLGEFSMRQRHLQLLGYKVVQILYKDFFKCADFIQKSNYVASLLRPYIKSAGVYLDV